MSKTQNEIRREIANWFRLNENGRSGDDIVARFGAQSTAERAARLFHVWLDSTPTPHVVKVQEEFIVWLEYPDDGEPMYLWTLMECEKLQAANK